MRGEVGNMLGNRLNDTMRQYNSNDDIRRSWDIMQHDVSSLNDSLYIQILYNLVFNSFLLIAVRKGIMINTNA